MRVSKTIRSIIFSLVARREQPRAIRY
jgi:hypothetical protein